MVRGEIIVPDEIWHDYYKNTGKYKDPRGLTVGLVGRHNLTEAMFHLAFYAYEIIYPRTLIFAKQFLLLKKLGFKIVPYTTLSTSLSISFLSKTLKKNEE